MSRKRKPGAKPKLSGEQERQLLSMLKSSDLPVEKIAAIFDVSRQTVYNIARRHEAPTEAA